MPAQARIQQPRTIRDKRLDARLRGHDGPEKLSLISPLVILPFLPYIRRLWREQCVPKLSSA